MDASIKDIIMVMIGVLSFIAIYFVKPAKDAAEAAKNKADSVEKEFTEYKLHVAENYVTDSTLEKHFARIEKQIGELKEMVKS